jgi:hypothetical protein
LAGEGPKLRIPPERLVPSFFARSRHWLGLLLLTVSGCAPRSGAQASRCYEVLTTVDSTGWGEVGEAWFDLDTTPHTWVDTLALSSVLVDPLLPNVWLPDSEPWYHVTVPSDSLATFVWRPQGDSVLIDTHDRFTGALYRLGRRGDTLTGGGIWIPDAGLTAAHSLRLIPLSGGCQAARQRGERLR